MTAGVRPVPVAVGEWVQCNYVRCGVVNWTNPDGTAFTFIDDESRETVWRYWYDVTCQRTGIKES